MINCNLFSYALNYHNELCTEANDRLESNYGNWNLFVMLIAFFDLGIFNRKLIYVLVHICLLF